MKKNVGICLLGLAILLTAPWAWAQGGKGSWLKAGKRALSGKATESRLSRQIRQRMLEIQANRQTEERIFGINPAYLGMPKTTFKELEKKFPKGTNPYDFYPYAPEGLTHKSLGPYMWVKDQLEYDKWFQAQQVRKEKLGVLLNTRGFESEIRVWDRVLPGEEPHFVVSQIKPDTQYVLIGEERSSQNVTETITKLLEEIRAAHPEDSRRIILFSEAYQEGFRFDFMDESTALLDRLEDPILRTAGNLEIPVIGLETQFVKSHPVGADVKIEGIRLRHERWLKTIRDYRELYPDALFIVQAGRGHISYYEPYSLGQVLAAEKTFVVEVGYKEDRVLFTGDMALSGGLGLEDEEVFHGLLEERADMLRKKNRILFLPDPQEARVLGFDARITVKK